MSALKYLLVCITGLVLAQYTECACTPSDVRTDLNKCLQYQGMQTYYQFPIGVTNYTSMCYNSTCFAYCIETTIQACQSYDFMSHLSDGSALKGAYLGFCDQNDTVVQNDLTCMSNADNQAALNIISVFETAWQGYYDTNTANNASLCSDWTTMKTNLDALLTANCTESVYGKTVWETFMNTIVAHCSTETDSFYASYSSTDVQTCNRAPAYFIPTDFIILVLLAGFLLWLM